MSGLHTGLTVLMSIERSDVRYAALYFIKWFPTDEKSFIRCNNILTEYIKQLNSTEKSERYFCMYFLENSRYSPGVGILIFIVVRFDLLLFFLLSHYL